MLAEETETFADLDVGAYGMVQGDMVFEPLDVMTSQAIAGSCDLMGPMMMNIINPDETTLCMEDYKYIQEDYKYMQDASFLREFPIGQTLFPPAEPTELCNTDYAGPLNFEVFVDPNVMKNPWEYSPALHKIYIDMKHKFPINFSVRGEEGGGAAAAAPRRLFVRVMPMFEEDRYFQELVHRCICHGQLQDPTNSDVSEAVAQHIIRCDNGSARYFGDRKAGKRLCIVIPLSSPQAGTDSVKEFFHFVCKNSCVGGMNRRPIQVIFTLEDECGNVMGRRVLCVRICSCPKRDREKEEKKREKHETPPGKKRKMEKKVASPTTENCDTTVFPVNINVVGKENYKLVLKYCQTLMSNEIVEAKTGNSAPFKKCRDEVTQLLGQIPE